MVDSADYLLPSLVPQSCCDGECRDSNFYDIGCAKALTDWAVDAGAVLAGVAIGLGLVEVPFLPTIKTKTVDAIFISDHRRNFCILPC